MPGPTSLSTDQLLLTTLLVKLAVMAAMNITDDLFRLQEAKGSSSKVFESRAEELIQILDRALQTAS